MLAPALEHGQGDLVVGAARVGDALIEAAGPTTDLVRLLEGVASVAGRVDERPVDVPENQEHAVETRR